MQARNQPSADGGSFFLNCGPLPVPSSLPSLPIPSPFPSIPPLLSPSVPCPIPSFLSPPGVPNPLTAARGSGGALKLPQPVRVEPGRQAVSGAF